MTKKATIKVYRLIDASGRVFYVGVTSKHIVNRVNEHLSCSLRGGGVGSSKAVQKKIAELNHRFTVEIIETIEFEYTQPSELRIKMLEVEHPHIIAHLDSGEPLVNSVIGRKIKAEDLPNEATGQTYLVTAGSIRLHKAS